MQSDRMYILTRAALLAELGMVYKAPGVSVALGLRDDASSASGLPVLNCAAAISESCGGVQGQPAERS